MKDLEKQMLADASDASARTKATGGNSIGIRNSKFTYKSEVIGRTLDCVVVDFVFTNAYYDDAFDPDAPAPPACIAISVDGDDMAPVPGAPKPQSELCDGCPKNAWGSADVGRGKACSEQYRLAVIQPGPGEDYSTAEMAVLTFPPTSRGNWTKYVKKLAEGKRPPYGVVTEFSFEQDAEYPILECMVSSPVKTASDLNAIMGRRNEARDMLTTPPDFSGYVKPTRKKASKKKTAKKKKAPARKKRASKKAPRKKASKKKAGSKSKFS